MFKGKQQRLYLEKNDEDKLTYIEDLIKIYNKEKKRLKYNIQLKSLKNEYNTNEEINFKQKLKYWIKKYSDNEEIYILLKNQNNTYTNKSLYKFVKLYNNNLIEDNFDNILEKNI
jgi:hypothetical protein